MLLKFKFLRLQLVYIIGKRAIKGSTLDLLQGFFLDVFLATQLNWSWRFLSFFGFCLEFFSVFSLSFDFFQLKLLEFFK